MRGARPRSGRGPAGMEEVHGLRKLGRRESALLGLLAVTAVVLVIRWLSGSNAAPAAARSGSPTRSPSIPRIDLARLDQPRGTDEAGRRDLFAYGQIVEPRQPDPTPPPRPATPPPTSVASGDRPDGAPGLPVLPPLNLKYIGSVEAASGLKVAVLVTDRREVLTGQTGQVLANRYRIARIGLESVDLEDVGTGQSRRIPLRAN